MVKGVPIAMLCGYSDDAFTGSVTFEGNNIIEGNNRWGNALEKQIYLLYSLGKANRSAVLHRVQRRYERFLDFF